VRFGRGLLQGLDALEISGGDSKSGKAPHGQDVIERPKKTAGRKRHHEPKPFGMVLEEGVGS
jgi:hypothetical protein